LLRITNMRTLSNDGLAAIAAPYPALSGTPSPREGEFRSLRHGSAVARKHLHYDEGVRFSDKTFSEDSSPALFSQTECQYHFPLTQYE
jgi:hypothetical protein